MKKLPIFVLILFLVILLPFFLLLFKLDSNTELKNNKNSLFSNYSQYKSELIKLGYNTELTTENGEQFLIVYDTYVTYKFNNMNSCTASFSNKSDVEKKYNGKMYAKNIEEDTINVTVVEIYQNMQIEHSCSYDSSGFDTIIADSSDFDKQDREIKDIISNDYKLSTIYAKMISINNDLKNISSKK